MEKLKGLEVDNCTRKYNERNGEVDLKRTSGAGVP